MFERLKRKAVDEAREEIQQAIRGSSNEGRIRTGSVIVEGLLFFGILLTANNCRQSNLSYHPYEPEIHIHIHEK